VSPTTDAPSGSGEPEALAQRQLVISGLVLALSLAALFFPLLALPALVGTFIAFLAASRLPSERRKANYALLALSAVLSVVAFVRFLKTEAVAGIVQGGTRATEVRAVSRLREILFAEDVMRRHATWDPDEDRIGSAGLLGELTGELGLRGHLPLVPPLLEGIPHSQSTSLGPAHVVAGYFFAVCLPTKDGGFSAKSGAAFDDEASERRFLAYAWPVAANLGLGHAFMLDEHENILQAESKPGKRTGFDAPPCDDAVAEATRKDWTPWQKKKPRERLPGDEARR
jgi:hypothetical protein